MYSIYPMKFTPILLSKVWGGDKIKKTYSSAINSELENIGEMWCLSDVEGNRTEVENGPFAENTVSELSEIFMDDLLGEKIFDKYNKDFPLLIKIIDAKDFLSVQVHPNDELANKNHGLKFGKSEIWYVLEADENAEIVLGFNKKLDAIELKKIIENGSLKEVLNFEKVNKGDIINIPAGMVHALGNGLLIAEVQQTSDITYRLYDWDRKDSNGKGRELHIEESLIALNFDLKPEIIRSVKTNENSSKTLINTPYFETNLININSKLKKDLSEFDSCVIYFAVEKDFKITFNNDELTIKQGECVLVPALTESVNLESFQSSKVIEIIPL